MQYRGSKDTTSSIMEFLKVYGAPPYILNIYGEYGIGKTTSLRNTISLMNDIDLIDMSEQFNRNPKKFQTLTNGIKPTFSFTGKKLVYFIRYPSMNKFKYDVLSKLQVPTIVITTEKLYKLNTKALYVKHPKPNYQMFKSALLKYIKEHEYPSPKPSVVNKILSMSENYIELFSLVDNLQPDYDFNKLVENTNINHYDDFTLLNKFFRGNPIPYHKLLNPRIKEMIVYTIIYGYRNTETISKILKRLSYIDRYHKKLRGDIQQMLVNEMIDTAPSNTKIYRRKYIKFDIPEPLWNYAKSVAPDNPLYVIDLLIQMKYVPDGQLYSSKDIAIIKKFYDRHFTVMDVFNVDGYDDMEL